MPRYLVFFVCRAFSVGLSYSLSLIGIAVGSDVGRLVAFLDVAKPAAGLFDSLAMRANSRFIASQMFLMKAVLLLLALIGINFLTSQLSTVVVIATYIVIWWLLTSYSTIYMRGEILSNYKRQTRRPALLIYAGIIRIVTKRTTIVFLLSSTVAAGCYANLYLFPLSKQELLALRFNDATLTIVSFAAALIIRGDALTYRVLAGVLLVVIVGAASAQYVAGGWFGIFVLFRVSSVLLCARAMRYRKDKLLVINQTITAAGYFMFTTLNDSSGNFWMLIIVEFISVIPLCKFGGREINN